MSEKLKKTLKKELSQNFLINEAISSRIVNHGNYNENKIILEIGCGKGALTQFLAQKKSKAYHIVELDPRWAKYIQEEYKNKTPNLNVYNENILDHQILSEEQYVIVGNIPYHITYPILEKIFLWSQSVDQAIIMMQEEVAQKITKQNGSAYGPISIICQLLFDVTFDIKIMPEDFIPQPKVHSRIVLFKKKSESLLPIVNLTSFKQFLGYFFSFPRKKIKHQGVPAYIINVLPKEILDLRAQEISPKDFYFLYQAYENKEISK